MPNTNPFVDGTSAVLLLVRYDEPTSQKTGITNSEYYVRLACFWRHVLDWLVLLVVLSRCGSGASMYRMLVQKSDNKLFIMVGIINIVTWF